MCSLLMAHHTNHLQCIQTWLGQVLLLPKDLLLLLMMWFVVVVASTIVNAVDAAFHSGTKHGYGDQIARLTGNAGGVVRQPP